MRFPSPDKDWFVVRTKIRAERLAAEELRLGGFESYLPMRRVKNFVRRQRLIINHTEPVLPGYVFLATETWRQIDWGHVRDDLAFRHVGRPLRGSSGPLRIPSRLIIDISVDETAGKFDETGATKKANHKKLAERFAEGNEFRVLDGLFTGFNVISKCVTGHDRIVALVQIFGRLSRVEFDPHQLEDCAA